MSDPTADRRHARINPGWILAGIVLVLASFNALLFRVIPSSEPLPDWLMATLLGAWTIQPFLIAIWTALAPGWFVTRAALAIPCLIALIAAPGIFREGYRDMMRLEFISFSVAGFVMFGLTTVFLLLGRRFAGWRIEEIERNETPTESRLQFDVKFLIAVLTVSSVALGLVSNLQFKPWEPQFFGPSIYYYMIAISGSTVFGFLLPMLAVPLLTLGAPNSKRSIARWLIFWLVVTAAITMIWFLMDENDLFPSVLLLQLGGAVVAGVAAFALRLAGYRLVRHPSHSDT